MEVERRVLIFKQRNPWNHTEDRRILKMVHFPALSMSNEIKKFEPRLTFAARLFRTDGNKHLDPERVFGGTIFNFETRDGVRESRKILLP